jgi:hypothetical protein
LPHGTRLTAFDTDVCHRENTDVRWVGFHPPSLNRLISQNKCLLHFGCRHNSDKPLSFLTRASLTNMKRFITWKPVGGGACRWSNARSVRPRRTSCCRGLPASPPEVNGIKLFRPSSQIIRQVVVLIIESLSRCSTQVGSGLSVKC